MDAETARKTTGLSPSVGISGKGSRGSAFKAPTQKSRSAAESERYIGYVNNALPCDVCR